MVVPNAPPQIAPLGDYVLPSPDPNTLGFRGGIRFSWGWAGIRNMPYNLYVYNLASHFRKWLQKWWASNPSIQKGIFALTSTFIPQKTQNLVSTAARTFGVNFAHMGSNINPRTGGVIVPVVGYQIPVGYPSYCNGLTKDIGDRRWQHFFEIQWGKRFAEGSDPFQAAIDGDRMYFPTSDFLITKWKLHPFLGGAEFPSYYPPKGEESETGAEVVTNNLTDTVTVNGQIRVGGYYLCYDSHAVGHWGIILRHNVFQQAKTLLSHMLRRFNQLVYNIGLDYMFKHQDVEIPDIINSDIAIMHSDVEYSKGIMDVKAKDIIGDLIKL